MPRTRSLAWSELKVGVMTIAAIVIGAILIFSLTGSKGFSWQRYPLKSKFANVAGLAVGAPVRVAGKEVGTVLAVEFSGEQIDVTFDVNKNVRHLITTASIARLGSVSVLGESAVDISPSTKGTEIPDYGYVPTGAPPATFADIADKANGGMEDLTALLREARGGRGTVGKLLTDDQLYSELRAFVSSANGVTTTIRQGKGTLGKLLNDPATVNTLNASLHNLEELTKKINAGDGSIGKLLKDDAFSQSLTSATSNMKELTDRLNKGEGTAGKLLTDPALFNKLNDVTTRLDDLVTKLNAGEGTAGQLLKDKQLYENMNKAVADFSALLTEIKKDPKKYLNVKVSIW
jgi:phospholipid/cholesterol/gamma-HCH transport system substrate-binding protein